MFPSGSVSTNRIIASSSSTSHDAHSASTQTAAVRRTTTFQEDQIPPPSRRSTHTRQQSGGTLNPITSRVTIHTLGRVLTMNLQPERKVGPAPGFWQGIKSIIFMSCKLSVTEPFAMFNFVYFKGLIFYSCVFLSR